MDILELLDLVYTESGAMSCAMVKVKINWPPEQSADAHEAAGGGDCLETAVMDAINKVVDLFGPWSVHKVSGIFHKKPVTHKASPFSVTIKVDAFRTRLKCYTGRGSSPISPVRAFALAYLNCLNQFLADLVAQETK